VKIALDLALDLEIREHEGTTRVAFSPDGARFVAGDTKGKLVVRSAGGTVLTAAEAPPLSEYSKHGCVTAVAWSPDGAYIATLDNAVIVRLRRADDLTVVGELKRRISNSLNRFTC
jgi:WD40 repeat protein